MSQLLAPTQSDSSPSRVSHFLPTVKCSSCSQPVPLSSLGAHVCSSQQPPPLSSKQTQPPLRQLLVPPQESRPRSNSQSVPRSSPMSNATSHVPFPTISTPPPRPEDYMPGGESGMAGVGRRAFQAAAHAAIFAQHKQIHQYPYNPQLSLGIQGNEYKPPQFLDIAGSSGRGQSSVISTFQILIGVIRNSSPLPEFHPILPSLSLTTFTTLTISN